jgi:glycosyltransferase 2 family protein
MLTGARGRGLLLGIAISVAAAALLAATTDFSQVAAHLQRANVLWLAPAFLVLAGQAWIRAARWASLIRPWSDRSIGARRVVDAMLIGYFANAILPGRLGEVARALVVSRREALAFGGVAASVVVERAIDIMALAALAAVALAVAASDAWIGFAALASGVAVVIGLGRRSTVLERLLPARTPPRLADGIRTFVRSVAAIPVSVSAGAAALSAIAWLADATLVLLVAKALGIEISVAAAIAVGLGGALGSALPAAPGYLATYELGAVTLGAFAGVPRETALPLALLVHVIGVTTLAAAGGICLGRASGLVQLKSLAQGGEAGA